MHMHGGSESDPTVANLSLSDPRCNSDDCIAFEAAHNYSQATVSYYYQYEYGHWTTWYYIIVIFLFMLVYAYNLWNDRRTKLEASQSPSVIDKFVAVWRSVCYRRYRGRLADRLGLPSLGIQIFLLAAFLFAAIATFAVRPYYRERRGFGSPPLAIRTGLMSIALTPIIFALGGKVNIVTLLTGIGYEKLNVIHRWTSYLCFALAVVHTVPFIVAPLRDGGSKALHEQFYSPGGFEYTGTPPLAILFFLVAFSIPYIRHRIYELFVYSHWFAAIAYLGLIFWHAGNLGDSWVYLWASLALLLFSILIRVFHKSSLFSMNRAWLQGYPSSIQRLPTGDMVKLQIFVPRTYTWRAGQHCFLRIPQLSVFDNHPFTMASVPGGNDEYIKHSSSSSGSSHSSSSISRDDKANAARDEVNTLTFLIRPHSGFTRKLAAYASANTDITLQTFVDGPYGGLSRKLENAYDNIVLVAGGGGITASISWLLFFAKQMGEAENSGGGKLAVKQVKLVWVVRQEACLEWVKDELEAAVRMAPRGTISFEFYVSRRGGAGGAERRPDAISSDDGVDDDDDDVDEKHISEVSAKPRHHHHDDNDTTDNVISHPQTEKSPDAILAAHPSTTPPSSTRHTSYTHHHRPSLPTIVEQCLPDTASRTCFLGCGPESMKVDLCNAVAGAQKRVLRGGGGRGGRLKEVAVWVEGFGW